MPNVVAWEAAITARREALMNTRGWHNVTLREFPDSWIVWTFDWGGGNRKGSEGYT
jgi:hypothetical protein